MESKTMLLQRQNLIFERSAKFAAQLLPLLAKFTCVVVCLVAATQVKATNLASHFQEIGVAEISSMQSPQLGLQTIAKGYRSGVRIPLQVVARNQNEWETLWRRHASIDVTPPPLPAIDFEKYTVVGLFLGDKPTGGYEAEIIRAELSNTDLVILYREKAPSGRGVVIQSLTQPYHIVQVTGAVNSGVIFRRDL